MSTVDTVFDPAALRVDDEGRLYHPVSARRVVSKSGKVKSKSGGGGGQKLALLEDKLVQMIAAGPASFYSDADASGEGDGGIQFEEDHGDMSLSWLGGVEYPIRRLREETEVE